MTQVEPQLRVDYSGLKCPQPIVRLRLRIGDVEPGQLVEMLADDPAAGPDLAAWCRMVGHELVASDPPRFLIRRLH